MYNNKLQQRELTLISLECNVSRIVSPVCLCPSSSINWAMFHAKVVICAWLKSYLGVDSLQKKSSNIVNNSA